MSTRLSSDLWSELRTVGFDLREGLPLQLEVAERGGQRTRGAALK